MDYKEKYEKALEWMKSIYPTMQGSDKEDAEHYFPELAESEDERIRKELVEQLEYIIPDKEEYDDEGRILPTYHKRIGRYRAYLERQKEQPTNSEIPKESKPAWSEEDEEMRVLAFRIVNGFKNGLRFIGDENNKEAEKVVDWLKSLRHHLSDEEIKKIRSEEYTKGFNDAAFGSKQEWSEEDEEIFNNIIEKAKGGYWIEVNEITWLITHFKSLHPVPHWKPSEEQMKALEKTIRLANFGLEEDRRKVLISLYEQLKKLM